MSEEKYEHAGYKIRLFLYRDRWALDISKGKARKIKSLKTKDLIKARDEFYKYKLQLKEKGRLDIVFDTDLFRQIEIFLEWSKVNSKAMTTYKSHVTSMRIFREFIEKEKIDRVSRTMFEAFKSHLLDSGNSPRTVDLRLTAISGMITVLENLDVIPGGTYPKPKLIRAKKVKAPKFWTEEEVKKVIEASSGTYITDMILLALNTGLRRNEVCYLRWDDVNLDRGFLLVQGHPEDHHNPKDYEIRRIKLNRDALSLLIRIRTESLPNVPYVFPNKYGHLRTNNLDRDLRLILAKTGIPDKGGWHCARRTFASHLLMAGADLESVRQLLGHSDLDTTKKYLNVTDQHLDKTLDLIGFRAEGEQKKVIAFKKRG
ncbi:MAG: tyrosine-type recombinase/integrase [Deltaproteobacteria bacterium]|nr:tyrosine-type recombinase/integrase [Candidatus Zymogenaceae bacterium]